MSTNLQICLRPSPPTLPRDPAAACYTSDKHDIIHILIQYTSCNISIAFGMALSERFGDMGIPPANFLCNYTQMSAALETLQSSTRAERYDSGAIVFHWTMFVLVVCVGVLGLLHDSWPKQTQRFWINIHALLGLALWTVLIARFWWRRRHAPPAPFADLDALSRRLSEPVHFTLYALLFVTPIVGLVTFVYHGRVLDFGVFQVNFGIASNRAIFHPTEDLHGYLAYAIFGLAGVHALVALWHKFVLRDGLLARMWPKA